MPNFNPITQSLACINNNPNISKNLISEKNR